MSRIEYKYLVPVKLLSKLYKYLSPYMVLDKYSEKRPKHEYTVRSIYFDTARLNFYHEKVSGIKKRKKIRIRGYNENKKNAVVFLEIKRKNGPTISKERAGVYYDDLSALLETGDTNKYIIPFPGITKSIDNARKFLFHLHDLSLKPILKIIYEREAYYFKFNKDWRITFDKNLRSSLSINPESLFEENKTVASLNKYFILEIKGSGEIPYSIRNAIARLELRLQALSKYTICIDSHTVYEKYLNRSINNSALYHKHKKINHFAIGQ